MGDKPVEALFPDGRERFELGSSGWSWVWVIDLVGGPATLRFGRRGRCGESPVQPRLARPVTLAGVVLDLVGEVDDQLGSLCQVVTSDGLVMQRWWNAWEEGQRTWVGRRQRWEAQVQTAGQGPILDCARLRDYAPNRHYLEVLEAIRSG
jgi:hypothetical protein